MPRIRSLKPEFWADEKLSLLDALTRLVFLGLISMADDAGRLVDNVKLLDGQLFPNTDDTCREPLDTLARMGRVLRYRSSSGQSLIQITNWAKHQKVDNPSKYNLPGPETAVATQPIVLAEDEPLPSAPVDSVSIDARENGAKVSPSDHLPSTNDHRPPTPEVVSAAALSLSIVANKGLGAHPTKPQRIARIMGTSGRSYSAAEAILLAGIPLAFAESQIYEIARTHTNDSEIRSLVYFVEAVARAWQVEQEQSAATNRSVPRANGKRAKGPPQKFDYSNPTSQPEDIKWQD